MINLKQITKVRVVTRGIVPDIIAKIKNSLGMRINEYELMINKTQAEIWSEIAEEELDIKWYRYEISQLTNGAMVIIFYGELN